MAEGPSARGFLFYEDWSACGPSSDTKGPAAGSVLFYKDWSGIAYGRSSATDRPA